MVEGPTDSSVDNHSVKKTRSHQKSAKIGNCVERLYSDGSASGWRASDVEAEERQAILSYRSERLQEASTYFQRKLKMEDGEGDYCPIKSLRNVTGPLKEAMLTLFQGHNEVHALQFLKEHGVRNEVTKMDMLSIMKSEHLTRRDFHYVLDNFIHLRKPLNSRPNSKTTPDLPSHEGSSSRRSSDKSTRRGCSLPSRLSSSNENSVGVGSSCVNSGRGGSSRVNFGRRVSFGKKTISGLPSAVLSSSGKHPLAGNSVEDLGTSRNFEEQCASDKDFGKFHVADFCADDGCSFDKSVRGSTTSVSSIGLGDGINNTTSGIKLRSFEEYVLSNGTPKNRTFHKLCRKSGKSILSDLTNILELCGSPLLRVPDQNVICMFAEITLPNQNDCDRANEPLTPTGENMAGRLYDPLAPRAEDSAPTASGEIMTGRLDGLLAVNDAVASPTPYGEIINGRLDDPLSLGALEVASAQWPEQSPVPDGQCHWKDLPVETFQCPIRFCQAVEANIRRRVTNCVMEIKFLHEHMPATTLEMLWQLSHLKDALDDTRDSRVDIGYILANFNELSELQNVAVKRLLDYLKKFDDPLMDLLRRATTNVERNLPPLWTQE